MICVHVYWISYWSPTNTKITFSLYKHTNEFWNLYFWFVVNSWYISKQVLTILLLKLPCPSLCFLSLSLVGLQEGKIFPVQWNIGKYIQRNEIVLALPNCQIGNGTWNIKIQVEDWEELHHMANSLAKVLKVLDLCCNGLSSIC